MTDTSHPCWRKSTHSGSGNNSCVEVAGVPGAVAVRDSTDADGPVLAFTPLEWKTFTQYVVSGEAGIR
jgi:hypothetical protein